MGFEDDASRSEPEKSQPEESGQDPEIGGLEWWSSIVGHLSRNLARQIPSRSQSKGAHPRWWLNVPINNQKPADTQIVGVYRDGSWTYGEYRVTLIRRKRVPTPAKEAPMLQFPGEASDREAVEEKIRKLFAYVMVTERPRRRSPERS